MSDARNGTAPMAKAYQPAEVEPAVYQRWLEADAFAPDGAGSRARATTEPFTIIMPPPHVTGSLHLGHALRSIVEESLLDVMYDIPERSDVRKCIITEETIRDGRTPLLLT